MNTNLDCLIVIVQQYRSDAEQNQEILQVQRKLVYQLAALPSISA